LTRYFIFISFKGTSYHGWQVQPNSLTVQKILDEALSLILGEEISTTGAGRTDTGVHALVFCAHFDSLNSDLTSDKNLVFKINRFLPHDISVKGIRKVLPDSNARFSAISRTYKYFISQAKDPFNYHSCWFLHGDLDISSMNRASTLLLNHSDFTSFSRLHSGSKTNICKINYAGWERSGSMLIFTIKADRFLRNMVRAVVGTLVETGRGRITPEEFEKIIEFKNRSSAEMSAPAKGLFLADIEYPEEIFV
jgi:tRNA pseudouridine38-40 synthase